jgi:hypothetical protein
MPPAAPRFSAAGGGAENRWNGERVAVLSRTGSAPLCADGVCSARKRAAFSREVTYSRLSRRTKPRSAMSASTFTAVSTGTLCRPGWPRRGGSPSFGSSAAALSAAGAGAPAAQPKGNILTPGPTGSSTSELTCSASSCHQVDRRARPAERAANPFPSERPSGPSPPQPSLPDFFPLLLDNRATRRHSGAFSQFFHTLAHRSRVGRWRSGRRNDQECNILLPPHDHAGPVLAARLAASSRPSRPGFFSSCRCAHIPTMPCLSTPCLSTPCLSTPCLSTPCLSTPCLSGLTAAARQNPAARPASARPASAA